MKVIISPAAREDLREIKQYLRQNFPSKVALTLTTLKKSFLTMAEHPLLGRIGSTPKTREYVQPELPYILIYRAENDRLVILGFIIRRDNPCPRQGLPDAP